MHASISKTLSNRSRKQDINILEIHNRPHYIDFIDKNFKLIDLESIDLSQIQDSNEESLETKLENLNSELTEKNRLIEQMKSLLNNQNVLNN